MLSSKTPSDLIGPNLMIFSYHTLSLPLYLYLNNFLPVLIFDLHLLSYVRTHAFHPDYARRRLGVWRLKLPMFHIMFDREKNTREYTDHSHRSNHI